MFLCLVALAAGMLFFTWRGYYWLHARELRALADEVTAYGRIRDLELGMDDAYEDGGRTIRYDSYRFLNGTAVTHYRDRHDPKAYQPVYHIDEYCRLRGISRERYFHFRERLIALDLRGFSIEKETGGVSFTLISQGGNPVVTTLDYIPDDGTPGSSHYQKVAPHWYVVENG